MPKQDTLKRLEDAGHGDEVIAAFKAQNDQIEELRRHNNQLVSALNELNGVKERVERTEQAQVMTAKQRFIADLNKDVPDWQEINDNAAFHAFLAEEEGLSGFTRQEVLDVAATNSDSAKVIRLFKAFKDSRPKRKENIAPETGGQSAAPEAKKVFTRAEVAQFYNDLAMGRIKHGPEAQAKEAEILQAQQEGRIR